MPRETIKVILKRCCSVLKPLSRLLLRPITYGIFLFAFMCSLMILTGKSCFFFCFFVFFVFCFFLWGRGFFHKHSRIKGLQGNGECIPLTPHYDFHLLQRHLGIRRAITAGSLPLYIASSRTGTGNLWLLSASR